MDYEKNSRESCNSMIGTALPATRPEGAPPPPAEHTQLLEQSAAAINRTQEATIDACNLRRQITDSLEKLQGTQQPQAELPPVGPLLRAPLHPDPEVSIILEALKDREAENSLRDTLPTAPPRPPRRRAKHKMK